jgi:hypothetical protein
MTGLIAIEESGDTGQGGTRFFVMVAIVTRRSRHLLSTSKKIPEKGYETNFKNSSDEERREVLTELANSDAQIVYLCIDKNDWEEPYRHGNILYQKSLETLMECAMSVMSYKDVNIIVDESRFMKVYDMKNVSETISKRLGKNVKGCNKASSLSNKCIQIVDYVAGAIWTKHEKGITEFSDIIEEKISVARVSFRP